MKNTFHSLDRYGNVEIYNRKDPEVKEGSPEWDMPYLLIKCVNKDCPEYEIFWSDAGNGLWVDMVMYENFWFMTRQDDYICVDCIKNDKFNN